MENDTNIESDTDGEDYNRPGCIAIAVVLSLLLIIAVVCVILVVVLW